MCAIAQIFTSHDPAGDFALSPPLVAETAAARASGDVTTILTVPFLWTNNAVGVANEMGATGKADFHLNPDLMLRWRHQFDFVRITASADIAFDRYIYDGALSGDTLTGSVKMALTDGSSDLFVPYVGYAAMADYEPGFSRRDDIFNTFSLGFTSGIGFDAKNKVIPFSQSFGVGDWSAAIDVSAGRRLAAPKDFENVFAIVLIDVVYNLTDDLHLGLAPRARWRNYPDYFGTNRRDLFLALQARAELTPKWLTERLPGAEIDITIEYQRNLSNLPTVRYNRWELGPALIFTRHF